MANSSFRRIFYGVVPGAVELRKDLVTVISLDLPPMLVFDYPTAAALTDHLLALMPPKPVVVEGTAAMGSQLSILHEVRQAERFILAALFRDAPQHAHA
jgi:cellulose biosynthesis protein BcsQ